jgi:PKHD-type hydroxylase
MLTYNPVDRHNTIWHWAYKHNVLTPEETQQIQAVAKSLPGEKGKTGNQNKTSNHRKSNVKWMDYSNPDVRWILDKVGREIIELNNIYYNYDLYGYDSIQYTSYKPGDYYDWHMDTTLGNQHQNQPPRKLSATLLLNEDFKGGKFEFFTGYKTKPEQPELHAGSLIIFPSLLYHRVAPVTSGTRNSLVTWVLGPRFK